MEKLLNVTVCCTRKPLKWRIVLSVSYLLMGEAHFTGGFNDWKHINRLHEHENSDPHRNASLSAASFKTKNARVDQSFLVQIDKEKVYWRVVLKSIVAVFKFLCERGLLLRGGNEVFGSPQNGNFLGLLQLLGQFDDFLAHHIRRFRNSGRGVPSYLSSTIFNEFVQLMAEEVTTKNEVKKVKYHIITVNSIPDVIHVVQLPFIIRYVQDDGTIVERFLKFINSNGQHDAESNQPHFTYSYELRH